MQGCLGNPLWKLLGSLSYVRLGAQHGIHAQYTKILCDLNLAYENEVSIFCFRGFFHGVRGILHGRPARERRIHLAYLRI